MDVRGVAAVVKVDVFRFAARVMDVRHVATAMMDDPIGTMVDNSVGTADMGRRCRDVRCRSGDVHCVGGNVSRSRCDVHGRSAGHDGVCRCDGSRVDDLRSDRTRSHGSGREERFTVASAVEPKPSQVGPTSLEDDQRSTVVPTPELAHFFATLIDHAETLFLTGRGRRLEVDRNMQVGMRVGRRGRGFATASGTREFGNLREVPRRRVADPRHGRIADLRHGLLGQCTANAERQRHDGGQEHATSHVSTP